MAHRARAIADDLVGLGAAHRQGLGGVDQRGIVVVNRSGAIPLDDAVAIALRVHVDALATGGILIPAGASGSIVFAGIDSRAAKSFGVKGYLFVTLDDPDGTAQADRVKLPH